MGFMERYQEAMKQAQSRYENKNVKKSKFSQFFWLFLFFFSLSWLVNVLFFSKPSEVKTNEVVEIVKMDVSNVPVQTISNDNFSLKIQGLRLSDIVLKHYDVNKNSNEKVTLLSSKDDFAEIGYLSNVSVPEANNVWKVIKNTPEEIQLQWSANNIIFNRFISVSDNYLINVRDTILNKSLKDVSIAQYGRVVKVIDDKNISRIGVFEGAIADADSSIKKEAYSSLKKKSYVFEGMSGFVGFTEQYWETILKLNIENQTIRMKTRGNGVFQVDTQSDTIVIKSGETKELNTSMFAGPKSQKILSELAKNGFKNIGSTIDYGWFFFLSRPFLWALVGFLGIIGNFGISIILLTILIRIIMYPLTRKSFESVANMKRLQPEIQKIQRLYPNDKLKQQQEMMALYQRLKVNPMSGCLPMLLQIPIFFALYKALVISVDMRHASFLWISDLSMADQTSIFNLFGILPYSVPEWLPLIGLLPVLMGITMWWQQKIQSGNTKDTTPGMGIMKWLPVIFVFLFASLPAGLVLYWTVSNFLAIIQLKYMDYKARKRL